MSNQIQVCVVPCHLYTNQGSTPARFASLVFLVVTGDDSPLQIQYQPLPRKFPPAFARSGFGVVLVVWLSALLNAAAAALPQGSFLYRIASIHNHDSVAHKVNKSY